MPHQPTKTFAEEIFETLRAGEGEQIAEGVAPAGIRSPLGGAMLATAQAGIQPQVQEGGLLQSILQRLIPGAVSPGQQRKLATRASESLENVNFRQSLRLFQDGILSPLEFFQTVPIKFRPQVADIIGQTLGRP